MTTDDEKPKLDERTETAAVFPHHRLDAYMQARKMAKVARKLAESLPRGNGKLTDNLNRSAIGVPLLIAEAANRRSRAQKRQRFEEALGETGELAAAAELALDHEVGDADLANQVLEKAARVGAMLYRLEQKFR